MSITEIKLSHNDDARDAQYEDRGHCEKEILSARHKHAGLRAEGCGGMAPEQHSLEKGAVNRVFDPSQRLLVRKSPVKKDQDESGNDGNEDKPGKRRQAPERHEQEIENARNNGVERGYDITQDSRAP